MQYLLKSIFSIIALLCLSTSAGAITLPPELSFYASGKIGFNQQFLTDGTIVVGNISHGVSGEAPSMSLGGSGGLRYLFHPKFALRGELEYIYRIPAEISLNNQTTSKIITQIHTMLINSYLDYYLFPKITLSVGVGIGVAIIDPSSFNSAASFAWQAGVGAGYAITDNITLDLALRYTGFSDYKQSLFGNEIDFPLAAVEVLSGIRYSF